jgi:transporter family-2 protein
MSSLWFFLFAVVVAGAAVSFQSPINAALARATGVVESAWLSFTVGWIALGAIMVVAGSGSVRRAFDAPAWQWTGGLLGAVYVTAVIVAAPRIGVTGILAATLVGQAVASLLIDHNGWFGLPQRPIDAQRVLGVALLLVAMVVIHVRR